MLTNVPGIRVHTDIEYMLWALEELFLYMLGVNIDIGKSNAWPGTFSQRLLVIDEFGTFDGMAARMNHRHHGTGPSPALHQRRQIECHEPEGRAPSCSWRCTSQPTLFDDSDTREQYEYRLITGVYTFSLCLMTLEFDKRIEWDDRIKGRDVVGSARRRPDPIRPDRINVRPERRRYALTAPLPSN